MPLIVRHYLTDTALGEVIAALYCDVADLDLPQDRIGALAVIIEELYTNTCKYGGGERRSPLRVRIELQRSDGGMRLDYSDNGSAFDPLTAAQEAAVHLPAQMRPIGGLGALLVARLADRADYHRLCQRNCVQLSFSFTRATSL